MLLHPDWREFLSLLIRHGVRFLVVGGHALAAHGQPRYTEDLDVFVDATEANARRLGKALAEFGYPAASRAWRQFAKPDKILFIGRPPLRIDVMTSISGVRFRDAWKSRLVVKTDLGNVGAIGLVQLRINKAASGRTKDLLDLELLDEIDKVREQLTPAAGRSRSTRRPPAPRPSRTRGTAARRTKRRPKR